MSTDEEIISKLTKGDQKSLYDLLYKRYYKKVLDKCFSFVRDRRLAEELTEDVFSKTYEKLGSFKHQSRFSSWLYAITYNHCIDLPKALYQRLSNDTPKAIDFSKAF